MGPNDKHPWVLNESQRASLAQASCMRRVRGAPEIPAYFWMRKRLFWSWETSGIPRQAGGTGGKMKTAFLGYKSKEKKSFWLLPDIIGSQINDSRAPNYPFPVWEQTSKCLVILGSGVIKHWNYIWTSFTDWNSARWDTSDARGPGGMQKGSVTYRTEERAKPSIGWAVEWGKQEDICQMAGSIRTTMGLTSLPWYFLFSRKLSYTNIGVCDQGKPIFYKVSSCVRTNIHL